MYMYPYTYINVHVSHLVVMAGALAVLCQCDHALVDELGIVGMDVEAEQHEPSSGDPTYAVQEAQGLSNEVVGDLATGLVSQVVLRREQWEGRENIIILSCTWACEHN